MFEMPSGVALLAIVAGLLFMFILIWGAAAALPFWGRLPVRLLAAAILIIAPLAFVAFTEIRSDVPSDARPAAIGGQPMQRIARVSGAYLPPS